MTGAQPPGEHAAPPPEVLFPVPRGVRTASWTDPGRAQAYLYECGSITNALGHTVLYVSCSDARTGSRLMQTVYYPSAAPQIATGEHRATGIVIDERTGDVYVCGESRPEGRDSRVVVLQMAFDLVPGGGIAAWDRAGVREFDLTHGDDRPEAIAFLGSSGTLGAADVVVVATTSDTEHPSGLACLRLDGGDGRPSVNWAEDPASGLARGVRSWAIDADPRPVELSLERAESPGFTSGGLQVLIAYSNGPDGQARATWRLAPDGSPRRLDVMHAGDRQPPSSRP